MKNKSIISRIFPIVVPILLFLRSIPIYSYSREIQGAFAKTDTYVVEMSNPNVSDQDSVFILTDEILQEEIGISKNNEFWAKTFLSFFGFQVGRYCGGGSLYRNDYAFSSGCAGCVISPIIINNTFMMILRIRAKQRLLERYKDYRIIDKSSKFYPWDRYTIKAGIHYSAFQNYPTDGITKMSFGISREWRLFRNAVIVGEFLHTEKGGQIMNRTIRSQSMGMYYEYRIVNIHCHIAFWETPVLFRYYIPFHPNFKWYGTFGPGFYVAKHEYSDTDELSIFVDENSDYDYVNAGEPGPFSASNSGFSVHIGMGIQWKFLRLEYRYTQNLNPVQYASYVVLNEKLYSSAVMVGVTL